jgi:DNA-binding transcriptional LysR family regulator
VCARGIYQGGACIPEAIIIAIWHHTDPIMPDRRIEDIRLADVATFLAVFRHRSVTAAARELSVTASQVSKAIARLELTLRVQLLVRQTRGVVPSEAAVALVPRLEELVTRARSLAEPPDAEPQFTLAAPSYLCTFYLGAILRALPQTRLRCLEVGPAFIRGTASENLFHLALTLGAQRLTSAWASEQVGEVRSALFAPPELAESLGPAPAVNAILRTPFVIPLYNSGGEFLPGEDGCPIPREDRICGHEAATLGVALELASHARMLVFGPLSAAHGYLASGRLVELVVPTWHVSTGLFLHVNDNRVTRPMQRALIRELASVTQSGALPGTVAASQA